MDDRRVIVSSRVLRILFILWFALHTFTIIFPLIGIPTWVLGIVGFLILVALIAGW